MIVKNVEEKDKKATIEVEVDAESFEAAVNKAYLANRGSISIPGFRKGKAPRSVIEGMYGKEVFYQDALDDLGNDAFRFGITESKTRYVGTPQLVDVNVNDDATATYKFTVELYPVAELGQYKEIELEKPEAEVTDEQLEEQLTNVQKRNARMVSVDRAAEMGDTANIDFDGYLDGEPFEGGKAEGYSLELGSNSFGPGFEEQVCGMKAGEEKDLDITFPEDYVEDLAGKAVVFKVKLNSLTAPEYPELDDEFAKDVSEFDTLDEYKADLKKTMLESLQKEIDSTYRSNLLKIASDNMTVEIPEVMVKDKAEDMIRNQAANYGVRGADITTEQLASMMGIDADTMENVIKPAADFQCRVDVLLETVAKQENIEVSDEEAEKYIKDICDGYGGTPEDLLSAFSRDFIINEYKKEKAADMIEESAKNVKGKKFEDYVKEEAPAEKAEEKAEEKPKKKTTRRSTKKAAAKEEASAEPKEEAPAEEETKE